MKAKTFGIGIVLAMVLGSASALANTPMGWPSARIMEAVLRDPGVQQRISMRGKAQIDSITVRGDVYSIFVTDTSSGLRTPCVLHVQVQLSAGSMPGAAPELAIQYGEPACAPGGASVGN